MQTPHVGLFHCDSILKGVPLRAFQYVLILYLRVIESVGEVLPAIIGEEFLAGGHFRGEIFGLPVEPGSIRYEVLLVEGVGFVEGEFVVVHMLILLWLSNNEPLARLSPTYIHTNPQFYCMAAQLNGSSYYRANPFYQQGYIPDAALKNRKVNNQFGELPQGEEFFQPTNKKHFQRIGYYSTIADQKIIHSEDPRSPAKHKDYFRSLNINDIQGATTNTLISKAVKNRVKAQEELGRRAQEELGRRAQEELGRRAQQHRQMEIAEKMRLVERVEGEKKRMEAMNRLKNNAEPNYHQLAKRMRTEEKQKMAAKHETNNQNQFQTGTYLSHDGKQMQKDSMEAYREQLEQADRSIKQLQMQLSQVRSQKDRARQDYQDRFKQPKPQMQNNLRNKAPVTYQNQQQSRPPSKAYRQEMNEQNPEQYYNYSPNKLELSPQEMQYLAAERQRQEKSLRSFEPLSGREHRQQHRRINPTFLSYGSASIGLAGKNIVGY